MDRSDESQNVGPTLGASSELLNQHQNVVGLSLSLKLLLWRIFIWTRRIVSTSLFSWELYSLFKLVWWFLWLSIPICYWNFYVNNSLLRKARLFNFSPFLCLFSFDLIGFRSTISGYILSLSSFSWTFLYNVLLCFLLFLVIPCVFLVTSIIYLMRGEAQLKN